MPSQESQINDITNQLFNHLQLVKNAYDKKLYVKHPLKILEKRHRMQKPFDISIKLHWAKAKQQNSKSLHITRALRASSKDASPVFCCGQNGNKIKKLALCADKRLSIKLKEMLVAALRPRIAARRCHKNDNAFTVFRAWEYRWLPFVCGGASMHWDLLLSGKKRKAFEPNERIKLCARSALKLCNSCKDPSSFSCSIYVLSLETIAGWREFKCKFLWGFSSIYRIITKAQSAI